MTEQHPGAAVRDLANGVASTELAEGSLIDGSLDGERILLTRCGGAIYAVGGLCTHYGTPLSGGIVADGSVRCPMHHACFDLRTGEASCAPAMDALPTYQVAVSQGTIRVGPRTEAPAKRTSPRTSAERSQTFVILGTGAAGTAAADMLRRRGFDGRVVMMGAEEDLPYDRPNLSKDYLAGTACDEWIPLKPAEFYRDNEIELMVGQRVSAVDVEARELRTLNGRSPRYDRLLIATGSEAVRLPLPTHGLRHVFTLRSLADSRAIIAAAQTAKRAVVVGSSFIGLEAAAALRARGIEVDVVAASGMVFDRVFGPTLSNFIQRLHESNGVRFHLRDSVRAIDNTHVTLVSGERVAADLVVVGIGVRPSVAVAQWAKLDIADGVVVNEYLETSRPGIFAAGDIARWPDVRSGTTTRVEHWNVALRQGQIAARNMLGERVPFEAVPFFWSKHYDVAIQYVGHQSTWDELSVDGDPQALDCAVVYRRGGKVVAVATIGRDAESLQAELSLERGVPIVTPASTATV